MKPETGKPARSAMGLPGQRPDADKVKAMFGRIAGRYDRANRALSFGVDQGWRRRLVREVARRRPRSVADLATGSGDVAFALERRLPPETAIEAFDFCQPMLEEALRKQRSRPGSRARFRLGNTLALPLPDRSVDAVTIAFGLRNLADRARGLREMRRVLAPGGAAYVLEFSQPRPLFRTLYYLYLKRLLPAAAGLIAGEREAYEYLAQSIERFPDREGIARELRQAGFAAVQGAPLALGAVALHIGNAEQAPD